MATKSARALVMGDVITDGEQQHIIRSVQMVAYLANGKAVIYDLPSTVDYSRPEDLTEEELADIEGADAR